MTSFFDDANLAFARAVEHGKLRNAEEIVNLVVHQMGIYLTYMEANMASAYTVAVAAFRERHEDISKRQMLPPLDVSLGASMVIDDLHELGHDIGRAQVRAEYGGTRLGGDNPFAYGQSTTIWNPQGFLVQQQIRSLGEGVQKDGD